MLLSIGCIVCETVLLYVPLKVPERLDQVLSNESVVIRVSWRQHIVSRELYSNGCIVYIRGLGIRILYKWPFGSYGSRCLTGSGFEANMRRSSWESWVKSRGAMSAPHPSDTNNKEPMQRGRGLRRILRNIGFQRWHKRTSAWSRLGLLWFASWFGPSRLNFIKVSNNPLNLRVASIRPLMTIHALWVRLDPVRIVSYTESVYSKVINKAGGLVYQRNFSGLPSSAGWRVGGHSNNT